MRNSFLVLVLCLPVLVFAGNSSPGGEVRSFNRNLHVGMKGADVILLQQVLKYGNFYDGPITGNYLAKTSKAVSDFQRSKGFERISGVFDQSTRTNIEGLLYTYQESNSKKVSAGSSPLPYPQGGEALRVGDVIELPTYVSPVAEAFEEYYLVDESGEARLIGQPKRRWTIAFYDDGSRILPGSYRFRRRYGGMCGPGSNCKISITDTKTVTISAGVNIEPRINVRVVAPNGGEVFKVGQLTELRMERSAAESLPHLSLLAEAVDDNGKVFTIQRITEGFSHISWSVGSEDGRGRVFESGRYKIRLTYTAGDCKKNPKCPTAVDESDSYFTVR